MTFAFDIVRVGSGQLASMSMRPRLMAWSVSAHSMMSQSKPVQPSSHAHSARDGTPVTSRAQWPSAPHDAQDPAPASL